VVISNLTPFVNFRAFRGKKITTKYTKNTKPSNSSREEICVDQNLFAQCNTFFTMKDMKSMKGWFAVNPDVSSYSEAFHYLRQMRNAAKVACLPCPAQAG
jgi:hypothetical protein